ncbi:MAG: hypothetical protein KME28_23955 [Pelatocladus maniniholoensis HA4357-MV3]|uniref:Uncharacterized protein n=1 Tax=Pelatocladus maniniholoensis HA4357-MV3 TaxID=1117104 RepID=A0A9E3LVA9_9NOST|nr:hypothetical protein [Pelatocladus maniniholoensis HA4357-MV3]
MAQIKDLAILRDPRQLLRSRRSEDNHQQLIDTIGMQAEIEKVLHSGSDRQ